MRGATGPGIPPDPDEVAAVEPQPPAGQEKRPAEPDVHDNGKGTFRDMLPAGPVLERPRPVQMVTNESDDAVQGALVDEVPVAPAGPRPITFDFADCFLTHNDRLVAAVRRYCSGDRALAEDVAQMTFLKAYQHLDKFAAADDPYAWLLTVATRVAKDVFRHERTRVERELDRNRLADRADDEWEGKVWMIALQQLPPPEHKVMWYRFVLCQSRRFIAHELGMSERAVTDHIRRALGRLRQTLDLGGKD